MDYFKNYELLINRAKNRKLDGYVERHHIIPVCMEGTNDKENIVELTPEEHYVAHQLLVKMYPTNKGLVWAVIQMTKHSTTSRKNNKLYGWLKRKNQQIAKQRTGSKNGSYGKYWYHNPTTMQAKKFDSREVPKNWIKGRVPRKNTLCEVCQQDTNSKMARFCNIHRIEKKREHAKQVSESYRNRKTEEDREKFIYAITTSRTWKEAVEKAGFKTEGYSRTRLQRFAEEFNISLKAD